MDGKRCSRCEQTKPLDQFPIRRDRGNKPRSHCRPCHNEASASQYSRRGRRDWQFRTKYGVTHDQVDAMIMDQDGRCAICRDVLGDIDTTSSAGPRVDHDHVTGRVRGVLCHGCNSGIGLLRDDPKILSAAIEYLER